MHRWEILTDLDLSDTGVSEHMMANIIIYTFSGIDYSQFVRNFRPNSYDNPECFINLQSIRAQRCPRLDVSSIIDLLKKLLFHRLGEYWDAQEDAADFNLWHVLRSVKSPLGSQIWRGPLPSNIYDLENTGLVGFTNLRRLYLANSCKMAVERDVWEGLPDFFDDDHCPYTHNVARYMAVTGALGIETELRFCCSYCDSFNAFLWDGWMGQNSDDMDSEWSRMLYNIEILGQLKTIGMPPFIKTKPEDPIPRMPYETRIQHPSGRVFYFPGSGGDHTDQLSIDDVDIARILLCDSAIDTLVSNFESYPISQKVHAINKMTSFPPPKPDEWQHPEERPEGYLAYIFRYSLKERNYRIRGPNPSFVPIPDLCTDPPQWQQVVRVKIPDVEILIKRMFRYPLPRRIHTSSLMNLNTEQRWWEKRNIALPEHPRGLCHICEREVWLCETCNLNPKAFCSECMTEKIEAEEGKNHRD
ncbi:hypothetical protein ABW19_dt0206633 [Dactylella cylindrospora]|nr:hypothetical protein ABW19_dt0206633 [Dactylella cylindrospora]